MNAHVLPAERSRHVPLGTVVYAKTSNAFFPRLHDSLEKRFWSKVSPEPNTGCWLSCGNDNGAYGSMSYRDETGVQRRLYAHRFSFELHIGEISDHLQIDHRCNQKLCVNPDHLRLATPSENVRRQQKNSGRFSPKIVCKRGHPLAGENLKLDSRGHKSCRTCARIYWRECDARRRAR